MEPQERSDDANEQRIKRSLLGSRDHTLHKFTLPVGQPWQISHIVCIILNDLLDHI